MAYVETLNLARSIVPEERSSLKKLLEKATKGDKGALSEAVSLIEASPNAELAWRAVGDLARRAEGIWIDCNAENHPLERPSLERVVGNMRSELEGPDPSAIERLLVDRIIITWLQVHHADREAGLATLAGASSERLDEHQKRQDRAQRRYLAALRSLALVRRLAVPAVQVNVAERQVNVAR